MSQQDAAGVLMPRTAVYTYFRRVRNPMQIWTYTGGTADAISQNIDFIDTYSPEYLLILSGDHIYKMNYAKMLGLPQRVPV